MFCEGDAFGLAEQQTPDSTMLLILCAFVDTHGLAVHMNLTDDGAAALHLGTDRSAATASEGQLTEA